MNRKKIVAPILIGACLAVALFAIKTVRGKYHQEPQEPQGTKLVAPEITSCVKGVRVIKVDVTDYGMVLLQVENLTDLGVIAVSFESEKDGETHTTIPHTPFKQTEQKEQIILIKPRDTTSVSIGQGSIFTGVPLNLGSVVYSDGTEEGCSSSLETLHEVKERPNQEPPNEKDPPKPHPDSR